jgi:hypothetical protein
MLALGSPKSRRFPSLPPDEYVVVVIRRHPACLVAPTLLAIGTLGAAILFSSNALPPDQPRLEFSWIVFAVFFIRFLWKTINWSMEYYIVTSYRVLHSAGILKRKIESISLYKVIDIRTRRPLLGRLLGYGHIVLESLRPDLPYWRLDCVPYIDQLWLELVNIAFPGLDMYQQGKAGVISWIWKSDETDSEDD